MDPLLAAVFNLGGGFALAAVILALHREALKAFRDELQKEREMHDRDLNQFSSLWQSMQARHAESLKLLEEIKAAVGPDKPKLFRPKEE